MSITAFCKAAATGNSELLVDTYRSLNSAEYSVIQQAGVSFRSELGKNYGRNLVEQGQQNNGPKFSK